jgi:hypothetical protein
MAPVDHVAGMTVATSVQNAAEDPRRIQPRAAYPRRCSSNASGLPGRNSARILGIRASSAGVARASIPAEILAYARAAYPQRRSSNANSLQSQNSAGFPQICAIFHRLRCGRGPWTYETSGACR